MNEHVIVDAGVGDVLQADPLEDPAEIDLAHQHVVLAIGLDHFAGYGEAHQRLLIKETAIAVNRARVR